MTRDSVYHLIAETARTWPNRPAIDVMPFTAQVYDIQSGPILYKDFLDQIDQMAKRLSSSGYKQGMRVCVLLENRPEFFIVFAALNKIGASIVPINPDLRLAELEYLFSHSEPALAMTIENRLGDLVQAAEMSGLDIAVITTDAEIPKPRKNSIVAKLLEGEAREAAVLYTSGTTGNPKGCVLPNSYFLLAGQWYARLGGLAQLTKAGERMITPLPVFHMNAMAYSFMAMVAVGGCLIALDRFHPKTWWQDVAQSQATCLHYLGVMPSILMNLPENPNDKMHNVRFGFGAGIDPKLHSKFENRFGIPLIEAWAMTETGAGAVIASYLDDRLIGQSSLGKPEGWVDTKVVKNDGTHCMAHEAGELLVRNAGSNPRYGFFTEYFKDPNATSEAWKDGWFHTGDLVKKDNEGRFFFVDRQKNVIRRSGENIAAVEVESVLMRHPSVKAAGVSAVPDALRGDEVFACLITDIASEQTANDIAQWALTQMAYYKVPGYIAFVDELPMTPTQKIQRKELKELALTKREDPLTHTLTHLKKRVNA